MITFCFDVYIVYALNCEGAIPLHLPFSSILAWRAIRDTEEGAWSELSHVWEMTDMTEIDWELLFLALMKL
jgi:hypothetical protein